jgi:hypothetical protein
LLAHVRMYSATANGRRFARLAGVAGVFVCAAFAGVAVTPENRVMALHVQFTLFAFRVFPLAALFLACAAHYSAITPRRVTAGWFFLTAALTAYTAVLTWGPRLDTSDGLVVQVIAQKAVAIVAVSMFTYFSIAAERRATA